MVRMGVKCLSALVALGLWLGFASVSLAAGGDGAGIRWIKLKGGFYDMGCQAGTESCDDWEQPVHKVTLDGFEISKSEVTVGQYQACVNAGACTAPHWDDKTCLIKAGPRWEGGVLPEKFRAKEMPVTCVDFAQAQAFAKWVGGRLPTEVEWEFAAKSRGNSKNFYPWGRKNPDCTLAVYEQDVKGTKKPGCGTDGPHAVCAHRPGNSEWGLCDMAGNVSEWVSDWFDPKYYASSPETAVTGPADGIQKVLRGGDWSLPAGFLPTFKRHREMPDTPSSAIGFRVVK